LPDWFLWMLPDYRDGLSWGDVVAWRPVVLPLGSAEVFFDDLLPSREFVPTAHFGRNYRMCPVAELERRLRGRWLASVADLNRRSSFSLEGLQEIHLSRTIWR